MNSDYIKTTSHSDLQPITHVLVLEDDSSRRTIILEEANYSIGRDPRNKIILSSKKVSRFHATLLRRTDTKNRSFSYWLLDGDLQGNRSTNGIFINEKRCLVQELKHEDTIRFGFEVQASYYVLNSVDDLALLQSGDFEKASESDSTGTEKLPAKKKAEKEKVSKQTLVISEANLESERGNLQDSEIAKLASFPELSPNPIIELDWNGNITYLNPSATNKFPELRNNTIINTHPLLLGLIDNITTHGKNNKLFVREIQIKDQIFEQYLHYLPDKKLIRSYIFDFTKRKALESQLQDSEQRYRAFISQTKEGVFLVDANSKKILEANNALADLLGYSLDEIYSLKLYDLIDLSTAVLDEQVDFILKSKKDKAVVREFVYKSKNKLPLELESNVIWISYGDQVILSFTVRPVTRNINQQTYIQEEGLYDLETGLPNRQLFLEQLKTAIANIRRQKGLLCIIFLELEILEEGKDTLGYSLRSGILDGFAKRLRTSLRGGDTVAHWESSQFVCLLPHVRSIQDVGRICTRMLEALKPPFFLENHKIHTKISIGVSLKELEEKSAETLLNQAQTALFKSKESGKNNFKFFDAQRQEKIERFLRIEKLLAHALDRNEFTLQYHPQVAIDLEKITGIEALIRWEHPDLGRITPDQFIPMAEETGLIVPMGEWVLETACRQRVAWQGNYLDDQPICVNISIQQFQQPNFVAMVKGVLEKTSLNPFFLELEIKETTLAEDNPTMVKILHELADLGVRVALDDFGTGISSIGYLRQFSFSTLKLDRPVIKKMRSNPQDKALVHAIITLSKSFDNLRIVAEGVEEKSQIEDLIKLGCQEIQGNWLTPPLVEQDMTEFLANYGYISK
ncbi:EAL domain-containing protein [Cyanobacterium aponinum FACHB-4101]|uniref:EAL domain-containing protein n=1 Tax=Cyanobacterium aponinum TaxID=379064 RepID=UPI001680AD38|nr:EAL domain-containing protein [Cyanobacterium aponinum]MBD2394285.1 EAL domain-containing protein [Cyanobacterium aponinum FACHB-4101]